MKKLRILITGGAGGLGDKLVEVLSSFGYEVAVVDRINPEQLNLGFKHKLLEYIQLDLSDNSAVQDFIETQIINNINRFDGIIINASPRIFKDFSAFDKAEIIKFINTGFLNQLLIVNNLLQNMLEKGFGRIIIISSKSGLQGYSGGSLYCSMKSAWISFHESVSRELNHTGKNVTITTLCPDSFSNTSGSFYPGSDVILNSVFSSVIKALRGDKSKLIYNVTFKTKFILSLQLLKKIFKIW